MRELLDRIPASGLHAKYIKPNVPLMGIRHAGRLFLPGKREIIYQLSRLVCIVEQQTAAVPFHSFYSIGHTFADC